MHSSSKRENLSFRGSRHPEKPNVHTAYQRYVHLSGGDDRSLAFRRFHVNNQSGGRDLDAQVIEPWHDQDGVDTEPFPRGTARGA